MGVPNGAPPKENKMENNHCLSCGGKLYWFSGNTAISAHGYCPACLDVAYNEEGDVIGKLLPDWNIATGDKNMDEEQKFPITNKYFAYDEDSIVQEIKFLIVKLNQAIHRAVDLQLKVEKHIDSKGKVMIRITKTLLGGQNE